MIDAYKRVMNLEEPPAPRATKGFFTDASLCIGCKACEVACKQWNQLPADGFALTGTSYDNTGALGATTWRHVQFIEQAKANGARQEQRWLFLSDVCKHCANAACLEACPTGALIRTEFDTVYVQQDICNGCGFCVPACPFGVIDRAPKHGQFEPGTAHKCTLCYDRLKDDMTPACAKSCPTASIQFGDLGELQQRARRRLGELHARGESEARLYGMPDSAEAQDVGPLHAFFLLLDEPKAYNLPDLPRLPRKTMLERYAWSGVVALGAALVSALVFGRRG
ncbi:MAG TPA: 4Fe-4S dicluster domain-containing protein [Candidatus Dormibacteraeota bacterium]|nr:4Fe-4S dicluster domain-containing protein [Candidatus Dormibacteraeota bacterium]